MAEIVVSERPYIIVFPGAGEQLPEGTRFELEETTAERHTGDGDCWLGNHYRSAQDGCRNCGSETAYFLKRLDG